MTENTLFDDVSDADKLRIANAVRSALRTVATRYQESEPVISTRLWNAAMPDTPDHTLFEVGQIILSKDTMLRDIIEEVET